MKCLKLTILAIAIVTVGLIAVGESRTEARSPSKHSVLKIVTGEVSKVEGEFQMSKDRQGEDTLDIVDTSYIITDQSGKEVRVELDDDTKVWKRVNPGDKVEAKISSEGHTLSVTRIEP
jgi:uncharacterized protein YdeI (BOF family)